MKTNIFPLCLLSLSLVGCTDVSEKIAGKAKTSMTNSSAVSSNQEITKDEAKNLIFNNRKSFEVYQVGDQREERIEGTSTCEGVETPYTTVTTSTILKIVDQDAYTLEEKKELTCGKESVSRRLVMEDLGYITYKEMEDDFFDIGDGVDYKFIKLSESKLEMKGTSADNTHIDFIIDLSKPGMESFLDFGNLKMQDTYSGKVDTSKINVDGLKIFVRLPGDKQNLTLVETNQELKDIFKN